MAKVSKVQKSDGTVIMDISQDTVNANNLLQGARAHGSDGEEVQGEVIVAPTDVTEVSDTTPYLYKASEHDAVYDELVGGSVAWNQLVSNDKIHLSEIVDSDVETTRWGTTQVALGNSFVNHTVLAICKVSDSKCYPAWINNNQMFVNGVDASSEQTKMYGIYKSTSLTSGSIRFRRIQGLTAGTYTADINLIDLTLMFGPTIADYVYTLEQSAVGSGIEWLKSYGFFTKDYYAYNVGGMVSVNTSGKKVVGKNLVDIPDKTITSAAYIFNITGLNLLSGTYTFSFNSIGNPTTSFAATYEDGTDAVNASPSNHKLTFTADKKIVKIRFYGAAADTYSNMQLELGSTATDYEPYTSITYPFQSTDLRGLYKLDNNNKLYTDGDIYSADGQITRKYGYRNYQSGDENLTDAITDGTHTIYKLSTSTTETAQPFISPQMVYRSGTEEYLDTRDVPIPVGGNRKYVDVPEWMVNEYFDDLRTSAYELSETKVSKSGDTMTGNLLISKSGNAIVAAENTAAQTGIQMKAGSTPYIEAYTEDGNDSYNWKLQLSESHATLKRSVNGTTDIEAFQFNEGGVGDYIGNHASETNSTLDINYANIAFSGNISAGNYKVLVAKDWTSPTASGFDHDDFNTYKAAIQAGGAFMAYSRTNPVGLAVYATIPLTMGKFPNGTMYYISGSAMISENGTLRIVNVNWAENASDPTVSFSNITLT